MRLIIVTFATLALAWYELSGGADFEAGDVSLALFAEPDFEGPVLFAGLVGRPEAASGQARVRTASLDTATTRASAIRSVRDRAETRVPGTRRARSATLVADFPAPIVAAAPAPSRDLRRVADDRVPVLARPESGAETLVELLRGETVAILRDGMTGWVQLRALDGGTTGWVETRHLEPGAEAVLASN
jgi:guanyl-specific ribonuclease Sa